MARTSSNMVSLGSRATDFSLQDTVTNSEMKLADLKGKQGTVIMFICNHCPYVKHVNSELIQIANQYKTKGISFIAISSNDATTYPEDGPDKMSTYAKLLHYPFPYLYDESQEVARAYQAACTPDFFVFDKNLVLAYRGQLDDSRPGNAKPLTGKDLRQALDCLVSGIPVPENQMPSIGCNIKWKDGN